MSDQDTYIVLDYDGWCRIKPENIKFQYIGLDESKKVLITGTEYIALNSEDKIDYIVEDLITAIRDGDEDEWGSLEVSVITFNQGD